MRKSTAYLRAFSLLAVVSVVIVASVVQMPRPTDPTEPVSAPTPAPAPLPPSPPPISISDELEGFSSNLPLVVVDTAGEWPDEWREWLDSTVTIFVPGESGRTRFRGPTDFSGRAGFRRRGRSSTSLWPKKQYTFEVRDESGVDRDVSILGMPAESDWILLGPYSDKSLIRNVLAYRWSNAIGRYASRTRLVELFLDFDGGELSVADYHGVYVVLEKPKLGPQRVALAPLDATMTSEPDITGGYLLRKDWGESPLFITGRGLELEYREPKFREIHDAQARWIEAHLNRFETALFGPSFADSAKGYEAFIDADSFIDHFLLVELTKNGDAYYHSTYLHKDRGRKLGMGPIWDYNLSMGNFGRGELSSPRGWYWSYRWQTGTHEWFARLLEDPRFRRRVADRWASLRAGRFSHARLIADIEELAGRLAETARRNFERWPVLGERVRYNAPGWEERDSYTDEIEFLRTWLRERLEWLDRSIDKWAAE